jgi:C-terminal processing protease CtpA/Prc
MTRIAVTLGVILVLALVPQQLAAQPSATASFDEAWKWEQGIRAKARDIWQDSTTSAAQVRGTIGSLDSLVTWVRGLGKTRYLTPRGAPELRWQESDILVDLAVIHARLGEPLRAAQRLQAAREFIESPLSPVQMGVGNEALFSFIAENFESSEFTKEAQRDPLVIDELRALRRSDRQRQFASRPFSLEHADTIPLADRIAGLSYVWSEAKYNFANFDLVPDLDWDREYSLAMPKVIAASATRDYYRVLQGFIGKLADGHTDIQVPSALSTQLEIRPRIVPELIDGRVFIRRIGHPAYTALGFAPGQEILSIDGVPAVQYGREHIEPYMASSTPQDRDVRTFTRFLLRGAHGTRVRLTIRDRDGSTKTLDAPRDTALAWDVVPPYVLRWLPNRVAHLVLNTFADNAVLTSFEKDLPEIMKARGVILDVRGNGGGNSGIGYSILSHLIARPSPVSAWSTPEYRPAFRSWNRAQPPYRGALDSIPPDRVRYSGPVALLIGNQTFSAAEDFAVAFDVAKRGALIGEPTGGSTGNPISLRLPGGGFARICSKRDRYPDGREFVGVGVMPTERVARTVAELVSGRDAVLEAGVRAVSR